MHRVSHGAHFETAPSRIGCAQPETARPRVLPVPGRTWRRKHVDLLLQVLDGVEPRPYAGVNDYSGPVLLGPPNESLEARH